MINGGCHDGGFSENALFVLMEIMVDTEIMILGHCSKLKIHDSRRLMNDDTITAYLHSCVFRTPGAGTCSEKKNKCETFWSKSQSLSVEVKENEQPQLKCISCHVD